MGRGKARRTEEMKRHRSVTAFDGFTTVQDFADRAARHLADAALGVFHAGRVLVEAKASLPRGQWLRLFRDHEDPVDRPLPFGPRAAQMLMAVAEHRPFLNANHGSLLPTGWRTLYELTKVPEPVFRQALTDGRVHPGMERRDVKALSGLVTALDGARLISTKASTPAAKDFDRLRAEVLSRPEFAQRWQALQELERKEEALAEELARVRAQARQERQGLTEDLQRTIEAEYGPMRSGRWCSKGRTRAPSAKRRPPPSGSRSCPRGARFAEIGLVMAPLPRELAAVPGGGA